MGSPGPAGKDSTVKAIRGGLESSTRYPQV